jgi:uncharacterized OB-fold protein
MSDLPMSDLKAVLPHPTNVSKPFWDACNRGKLLLPHCEACDRLFYYPRVACPHCGSDRLGWHRSAGTGTVFTFSHVQLSFFGKAWETQLPYTVVLVDLDEGVRFLSRLIGDDRDRVTIGAPVACAFRTVEGQSLPFFRLVG